MKLSNLNLIAASAATLTFSYAASSATTQPTSNLILYHDFENNLNDGSVLGNTHNGTNSNGAAFVADTANATAGTTSLLYDGVDDIVTYANGADLDMNYQTPFSLSLWIKPTSTGSGQAILSKSPASTIGGGSGTHTPALIYNNSEVRYDSYFVGQHNTGGGAAPVSSWTHIALTQDAAGLTTIYINGVSASTGNLSGNGGTNEGANALAPWTMSTGDSLNSTPFPANLFQGNIDEFAFWNATLDATQVADVYNNGVAIPEPSSLALLGLGGLLIGARRRRG